MEPNVDERLLAGDPAAVEEFDAVLRSRLEAVGVVRVKIWAPDGRIVYSDEPELVGAV